MNLLNYKPNLFIIGAMKSGTTSLHNYLSFHPDIFMSSPKELWFFVKEKNLSKGIDWYLSHFVNSKGALYIGESSADYTQYPLYKNIPQRIYDFNSRAKFIYIMRNPIERAISHYWYDVQVGIQKNDIWSSIKLEEKYVDFSSYLLQIEKYYEFFPKESIKFLCFEEMKMNPKKVIDDLYSWLNLNPVDINEYNYEKIYNQTSKVVEQVKGFGLMHKFRYSRFWSAMHKITPSQIVEIGKMVGYHKIDKQKCDYAHIYEYLHRKLSTPTQRLRLALNSNFEHWKNSSFPI